MLRDVSANFALAVRWRIRDNVLGRADPKQEKVALVTLAASELFIRGVESIKDAKHPVDLIETERKKNIQSYTAYKCLSILFIGKKNYHY